MKTTGQTAQATLALPRIQCLTLPLRRQGNERPIIPLDTDSRLLDKNQNKVPLNGTL